MDERSEIAVAHGGLLQDELSALGIRADDVLDLSVNVNPYGPCPSVRRAIANAVIHRYPDPTAGAARCALADHAGVLPGRIVVGNGAVDLLWTLARAHIRRDDLVVLVEPTFSEMRAAATRAGATALEYRTRVEDDFAVDLGALDAMVRRVRPRIVYVCSPANPTGNCTPLRDIEELAARNPDTLFVADISFLSMSNRHGDLRRSLSHRVVWVRSLTKDHALAGLRVGYVIAPTQLAERIEAERPPWSVNALAQAAAVATTTGDADLFVEQSRERLFDDRSYLVDALRHLGLKIHSSDTIYTLIDLGAGRRATDLRLRLLSRHRVLVRDATSFALPHHIRMAACRRADANRAVAALEEELAACSPVL